MFISWTYIEKLYKKQGGKCALTGKPIGYGRGDALSIDRIDCKKGYEIGNIQLVCKEVNYAKHTLSQDAFIKLCKDVVANIT